MDESTRSAAPSSGVRATSVRDADPALDEVAPARDPSSSTASFRATRAETNAGGDGTPSDGPEVTHEPAHEPLALKVRDRIGHVIAGRYKILELLGEGGMGAVYRGEHVTLHKRVAVKFLHPELSRQSEVVSRFQREAQAAAMLDHPNVVAAHDFGRDEDGAFFLVMDFVDGATLGAVLDRESRIAPERALHIARHVGAALARAHEMGIIHRDLKPDNIVLVQREGDAEFAKVIDFGIAKLNSRAAKAGPSLTQVGMVFGTPEYMAPEQALGAEVDHRADLYALGVVLFECIAGRRPFDAEDVVSLLGMQISEPVPKLLEVAPDLDVPTELDAFFAKALAKKPAQRFSTASEMVEAFSTALGHTFTGLGPAATGRNPILSTTGRHPAASVPSAISQKTDVVPTPSGPLPAVTDAPSPPAVPPPIVPLSEIARQSLVVIPRAAAETLAGATREAWIELAKDERRKRRALSMMGAGVALSLLFAIGAGWSASRGRVPHTHSSSSSNDGASLRSGASGTSATTATSVRGDNRRDALQHGQRPAQPPPNVPTVEQQPSTTPAQSSPQPPSPPTNQDLAADLAAFRAQPAIHVLLDPRGAMPLRARITALEALRTGGMDNALMSYTLGTLYARQGPRARSTMLDRYVAAVAARPELARDPQLLDDVLDAAQTRGSVSERARDFLRGPLRAHAPRQIVARLAAQRTKPQRERDIALLSADFANAIDATVLQIIEVYRARSCAQIKTAVDALAATGDVRAVPTLESIPRAPRRCGWFNTCNPCLGDSVDRAIAAVRRRPAPEAWR